MSFFEDARAVYQQLKANFIAVGRLDAGAWANLKEQQMAKASYFPTTLGHHWITGQLGASTATRCRDLRSGVSLLKWKLRSALLHSRVFLGIYDRPDELLRYGGSERVRRWRWLRSWAYEFLAGYGERPVLPVVWAVVVIAAFTVGYAIAGNIASDFAGDPATAHGSHNFMDALTHSIGAFATIGFNTLEPLGWGARLLTAIESALGVSLFALFIFTLGNRLSRS